MGAGRTLLTDVVSLDGAAAVLRNEYDVDRVSIARYSSDHARFEIVGCDGKMLLAPGLEVPVELSTQMYAAAIGHLFLEASFEDAPCWHRPVDQLMFALGFRGGCSLPVRCGDGSFGAVSISATECGRRLDRCIDATIPLLSDLGALLCGARRVRLSPRESDVLLDLDAG